jgi:hypothetical protein
VQDGFSKVAGAHQLSFGANLAYATLDSFDYANLRAISPSWVADRQPGDPAYDRGNCPYNQREIANFTASAQAPELTNYLNAAAFAFPAPGTLGDTEARSIEGPGFWKVDVSGF